MNILYVTTIGGTMPFFKIFIKELIDKGHTVDLACNNDIYSLPVYFKEWGCKIYNLSCTREPFSINNVKAIKEIKSIVSSKKYDIIHCHTPIASICTRLSCYKTRFEGSKIIYTVHGFHFYKGAPLKNWLLFYPIEWICSWMTDVLITINKEDFRRAKKSFHARKIEYIPGVGIDTNNYSTDLLDFSSIKQELDIMDSDIVLLSVGELNKNKNHETLIYAVSKCKNPHIKYFICGTGELKNYLSNIIKKLGLESQVQLLGFRTDIAQILKQTDIFVHPSFREGLPVSVMEAMTSGVPIVAGENRGTRDLIVPDKGGYLVKSDSVRAYKNAILDLSIDKEKRERMGNFNVERIMKFDIAEVNRMINVIYTNACSKNN